jgi:hypothetical protein
MNRAREQFGKPPPQRLDAFVRQDPFEDQESVPMEPFDVGGADIGEVG